MRERRHFHTNEREVMACFDWGCPGNGGGWPSQERRIMTARRRCFPSLSPLEDARQQSATFKKRTH